jgi:hypothetical protein
MLPGMSSCQVLRCDKPISTVVVSANGSRRIEWGVCATHAAEIEAGAAWRPDNYQRVIYMGRDFALSDEYVLTGFSIADERALGSEESRFEVTLQLTRHVPKGDTDDAREVTMLVPRPALRRMGETFTLYAGDNTAD